MGLTYEQSLEHFLKTFQKSKEMSDEAAKYIPGSYSRRSFNYGPHAIYVNNAKEAYVHTVDGKKLLDFLCIIRAEGFKTGEAFLSGGAA